MITFPRPMPRLGATLQVFELDRRDLAAPEEGGRLGGVQLGVPVWAMSLDLNNMIGRDADVWRAWLAVQRGGQRHFLGFDVDRPAPLRHLGGRPFTKSAAGWSQIINGDSLALLTLIGISAGTALSLGDYVDFRWGAASGPTHRRALVRVVAGAAADAAGAMTVAIEPPVPALVPGAAIAHLDEPACLMKLAPDTQLAGMGLGFMPAGGRVVAVQDLLP